VRFAACWWAAAVFLPLWTEDSAGASPAESKTSISIRWAVDGTDTNRVTVEVAGLESRILRQLGRSDWAASDWQRLFSVYAEQGDVIADIGLPPMLGDYAVGADVIGFKPRFPIEPGVSYRAIFRPSNLPSGNRAGGKMISSVFRAPSRSSIATTVVRQVYPGAALLPENLLKFYLHFSAPMRRGHIYEHIHLRDEAGKDVELPFLEIDEELWDPTMTRLTLFIDPGRIKREVKPLEEIGPALEAGKQFTLVIDSAWRDASGNRLREEFRKRFEVGPPDREPPDPARWKVHPPKPLTSGALAVDFPEPMDHALAERMIRVTDDTGKVLQGKVTLETEERQWRFDPDRPWRAGSYRLVVQTTIEDLAGNNIGKPFEVDLIEPLQRGLTNAVVTVAFEVR
jgi:hypothetical protein